MNNYYDEYYRNYYPVDNNIPKQMSNAELDDVYQGFLKGNMFNNLYDPYKNYKIKEFKPTNEREAMLIEIQAYYFSLVDLNLYLDVYPNNSKVINVFNNNKQIFNTLVMNYEKKYGPLTITGEGLNTNSWTWDNAPWPWEVMK